MDRCMNCGQKEHAHIQGRCPRVVVSLDITEESVIRAKQTGHPRTLAAVIQGKGTDLFTDVHIDALRV